jgi:hypothetical protein
VHLWSQRFGGTNADQISSLAIDSQGNAIVTGFFQGRVTIGTNTMTSVNNSVDTFLAKYSPTGAVLWAKNFPNSSYDAGTGVAVDRNDNILLTGYFKYRIDLGGGYLTTASGNEAYIAKFSSAGTYLWAKEYGANAAHSLAIAVDSNGDVAIAGDFYGQTDLGAGLIAGPAVDDDMFVAKYSGIDGSYLWSQPILGDSGGEPASLAIDAQNNVILTGYFYGTSRFGATSLTSSLGSYDCFVAKYSSSGTPVWAQRLGGTSTDAGNAVAVDSSGYPVVSGYFSGTGTFNGQSLTSAGGYDGFLLRLAP